MLDYLFSKSFICFDGDPDSDLNPDSNPDSNPDTETNDEKQFSQKELNKILADEKRKTQDVKRQLMSQLEEYKKNVRMSTEEKTNLENQIEELRRQTMTAEELAKETAEKMEREHREKMDTLVTERDFWHRQHDELVINADFAKSAAKHKAHRMEQIAAILRPMTKMVDMLDSDGKHTGRTVPRVTFEDVNKEGKPVTLELTIDETVKRMREMDDYSNLFQDTKNGGLGGSGSTGRRPGKIDVVELAATDPKRYREYVKENKGYFN